MNAPTGQWHPWVEEFILPYTRIPALWPVLFAILGHVVLVFTMAMLAVWRAPSLKSGIGLAVVLLVSAIPTWLELKAIGKPGRMSFAMGLTWVVAVVIAGIALETGFL